MTTNHQGHRETDGQTRRTDRQHMCNSDKNTRNVTCYLTLNTRQ